MPRSGRTHNKRTPTSFPLGEQGRYRDHRAQRLEVVWIATKKKKSVLHIKASVHIWLILSKTRSWCAATKRLFLQFRDLKAMVWICACRPRVMRLCGMEVFLLRSPFHTVGKSRIFFLFFFFFCFVFNIWFQKSMVRMGVILYSSPLHLSLSSLLALPSSLPAQIFLHPHF